MSTPPIPAPSGIATLVELLRYFDYKQHALPTRNEINKAIKVYKKVSLRREDDEIYFIERSHGDSETGKVTEVELKRACKRYTEEFWKKYPRTKKRKV